MYTSVKGRYKTWNGTEWNGTELEIIDVSVDVDARHLAEVSIN